MITIKLLCRYNGSSLKRPATLEEIDFAHCYASHLIYSLFSMAQYILDASTVVAFYNPILPDSFLILVYLHQLPKFSTVFKLVTNF